MQLCWSLLVKYSTGIFNSDSAVENGTGIHARRKPGAAKTQERIFSRSSLVLGMLLRLSPEITLCTEAKGLLTRIFHHGKSIERQALQSEAMGLCFGAARQLNCWSERLRKKASGEPSTKHAIETVRSVPRSSDLVSRSTECNRFSSDGEKCGLRGRGLLASLCKVYAERSTLFPTAESGFNPWR
jgi:hypothetical protein